MKLRHLPKKLSIITLLLSLVSCGFLGNDSKAQEGYVVQPNYDHPKFKELDAAFAKQEHRFEIDRCEFTYNDQTFFIGDSYDKIIEIFGEPDEEPIYTFDKKSYSIEYKKLKLLFFFFANRSNLKTYSISISNYKGHKNTPYKIIKFRKVPYHLDMTLNEFINLSDLQHGENLDHDTSAFYIMNEPKCLIPIDTEIGSTPGFESIGGGHMTMRGDFDPTTTKPIYSFVISLKEND